MRSAPVSRVAAACALAAALSGAACGSDSATTTSPTTTATASTEFFAGTLSPRGDAFYSFGVTSEGTVSITLASVAAARVGPAVTSRLTVGIGVPSGFGCSTTSTVDAAPGLSAQMTAAGAKDNIYCVKVSDPGVLSGDVLFVIRIVHT